MTLWWIGNAVFLLVIIPALLWVLTTLLLPARHIELYAEDIRDHGGLFGPHLDSLQDLGKTREHARRVRADLERYANALDQIP